jgi:hypothetical protein
MFFTANFYVSDPGYGPPSFLLGSELYGDCQRSGLARLTHYKVLKKKKKKTAKR